MLLLAVVAGNPRGTERLLKAIESAPADQGVTEFFGWDAAKNQATGKLASLELSEDVMRTLAITAKDHIGDLLMQDLQRWLPTVRRFSFRSDIARDASYADTFSRAVTQP
jgi:hypothetical protein